MIVYRVATRKGHGPYISEHLNSHQNYYLEDMRWDHADSLHPNPFTESPPLGIQPWQICAFASQDDLLSWFDGYEELLDELGFLVWEIEIPEECVTRMSRQILIDKTRTCTVATYTLV